MIVPHRNGPCWDSSSRTVFCERDPTLEQYEEEAAAEMKCYELNTAPTPQYQEVVEELRAKVSLGRSRCGGKVFLGFFLTILLSY